MRGKYLDNINANINVPLQRARRKLRELIENSKAAAAGVASAVSSSIGNEAVPSSTSRPPKQQTPPPSSTGSGNSSSSGGGGGAGASDTERQLLQKVSELEERLKDVEAARASGLEILRLTLQDGDKRTVRLVPLQQGRGGGEFLQTNPLVSPPPSLARTPAQATVASPGGGVVAADAVLGRWWGNGMDVLRSLAGGQKGGGSGS